MFDNGDLYRRLNWLKRRDLYEETIIVQETRRFTGKNLLKIWNFRKEQNLSEKDFILFFFCTWNISMVTKLVREARFLGEARFC